MVEATRRARALATAIKKVRVDSGVDGRRLSERLGLSHSAVSHWENGKRLPSVEDVAGLLGSLGVSGQERERILYLARHANEPNWLTVGASGIPEQLTGVLDCETDAQRITQWAPTLLPGILQTREYIRSTLNTVKAFSSSDVESRVFIRTCRREIFGDTEETQLHALIGEAALREPVAAPEILAEQMHFLAESATKPHVTVQVVRSGIGWHPGLHGPFICYEFPTTAPVVYFEHFSSGAFVENKYDVQQYRQAIEQLAELAMSEQDSLAFLTQLAREQQELA